MSPASRTGCVYLGVLSLLGALSCAGPQTGSVTEVPEGNVGSGVSPAVAVSGLGSSPLASGSTASRSGPTQAAEPQLAAEPATASLSQPLQPSAAISAEPAWLGIAMKQLPTGVVVEEVWRGSPADLAGVQLGDRVLQVADKPVTSAAEVVAIVAGYAPAARLSLQILRAGKYRLLSAVLLPKPDQEQLVSRALVGAPAPDLSGLSLIKGSLSLGSGHKGSVLVLDFWASWCPACRLLSPTLDVWNDELGVLGVDVLGITMDPPDLALAAAERLGTRYPQFVDTEGSVTRLYHATALPTLVIVDRAGIVRDVMVGYRPDRLPALRETLKRLARVVETKPSAAGN